MDYLPYLERILASYSEGDELEAVMEARSRFTGLAGRFSEEDPWHETWSRLFLDWFGFDFPVAGYPSPVHRYVVEHHEELLAENALVTFRGLMSTHRSVFEVGRWGRSRLGLVDVIGRGRFQVLLPFAMGGIQAGDVIDARIIPMQGELVLHDLIEHLRQNGQLSFKVVHLLARMNLQHRQGPSLKLKSIYSPKSFLIRSYT
jgi:hypothetical protein